MNRRILLIEDNKQNRYLVTYLLQARGREVTLAPDGPSGLELAGETYPALILLDIQLPGMDGCEVARRLRTMPELEGVPIVAATFCAMPGDREHCLEAGCTGYLEKPIDPQTFASDVENYLQTAA